MATGFGVGRRPKTSVRTYARSHARYALIGTSQHRGCVKTGKAIRYCTTPIKDESSYTPRQQEEDSLDRPKKTTSGSRSNCAGGIRGVPGSNECYGCLSPGAGRGSEQRTGSASANSEWPGGTRTGVLEWAGEAPFPHAGSTRGTSDLYYRSGQRC